MSTPLRLAMRWPMSMSACERMGIEGPFSYLHSLQLNGRRSATETDVNHSSNAEYDMPPAAKPPVPQPVLAVFQGGTDAAVKLKGRKVQSSMELRNIRVYNPARLDTVPETATIPKDSIGFVGVAEGEWIRVAFPKNARTQPPSLEALLRDGDFFVVEINWPTFQRRFWIYP